MEILKTTHFKLCTKHKIRTAYGDLVWTIEPSKALLDLHKASMDTPQEKRLQMKQYAKMLGTTGADLSRYSNMFGLRWTDGRGIKRYAVRKEIIALREQANMTYQEIGDIYGFSRQYAHQVYMGYT